MPVTLPFKGNDPFYSFSTSLEDRSYIFNVRWNARDGVWYFDLYDDDEDLIISRQALLLGGRPTIKSADPRVPGGLFIIEDLSGENVDATFEDLGVRVVVYYLTNEEAIALLS